MNLSFQAVASKVLVGCISLVLISPVVCAMYALHSMAELNATGSWSTAVMVAGAGWISLIALVFFKSSKF